MDKYNIPTFFQVVFPDTILAGKLEISSKFVEEYGDVSFAAGRESAVHLVVPNGDTWRVGVKRSMEKKNKVALRGDGWEEFMEHYSLGVGSLILFKSVQISVFRVCIFDISSTEIDYPLKLGNEEDRNSTDDSDDEEEEEEFDTSSEEEEEEEDEDDDECQQHLHNQLPMRKSFKGKSGNPSFRLKILPSYLQPKSRVTLPHAFVMENKLNEDNPLKVKLRVVRLPNIWRLKIYYRRERHGKIRRGEFSNAGWLNFCREAGIREGDICQFQLIKRVRNTVFFTMAVIP